MTFQYHKSFVRPLNVYYHVVSDTKYFLGVRQLVLIKFTCNSLNYSKIPRPKNTGKQKDMT